MKLIAVSIKRTESYQTPPNTLVGVVELVDEERGEMKIRLSPMMLSKFVRLIETEVLQSAQDLARQVPRGMQDALGELALQQSNLIEHLDK